MDTGFVILLLVFGFVAFRVIAGIGRRERLREEARQAAALVKPVRNAQNKLKRRQKFASTVDINLRSLLPQRPMSTHNRK
jgi:hypothetical protein